MFGPEFEREYRQMMGCIGCGLLLLGAAVGGLAAWLVILTVR